MNAKTKHFLMCLLPFCAFVLALCLRAWGIHWGIPTTSIPHRAFHPDEWWAMNVMQQMNLEVGDFNPEEAHREGPVCYYLWFWLSVLAQKLGFLSHLPYQTPAEGDEYAGCLLLGRWVVAILDSLGVIPLFFAVWNVTRRLAPAMTSALILAICPFEVIYGRFMRTHAPANLLVCVVFLLCSIPREKRSRSWPILSGIICGLAATVRYPTGAVLIVPGLILFTEELSRIMPLTNALLSRLRLIVKSKPLWTLLISFILTILFSAPHLIIDFRGVLPHIQYQASFAKTEELGVLQFFQPSRILPYFVYLLPYGFFPLLWIPAYGACAYLLWARPYRAYVGPVTAFLLLYFYSMAKAYLAQQPQFVRAVMPLFPGFALFIGLALGHFLQHQQSPNIRRGVVILLALTVLPSLVFDVAYSLALVREDPRIQVYHFFEEASATHPIHVGIPPASSNYFLTSPALSKFPEARLKLEERKSLGKNPQDLDFVVLTKFISNGNSLQHQIESLKASGNFELVRTFQNPLDFLGLKIGPEKLPHDMSYPFPEFYIFRRKKS